MRRSGARCALVGALPNPKSLPAPPGPSPTPLRAVTLPHSLFWAEKERFGGTELSVPGLWDIPRFSLLPGRSRPHPDPSEGRDREGVGRAAASIFMRLQRIQAFKYSSGERSLSLPAGKGGKTGRGDEKREEGTKNGKRGRAAPRVRGQRGGFVLGMRHPSVVTCGGSGRMSGSGCGNNPSRSPSQGRESRSHLAAAHIWRGGRRLPLVKGSGLKNLIRFER